MFLRHLNDLDLEIQLILVLFIGGTLVAALTTFHFRKLKVTVTSSRPSEIAQSNEVPVFCEEKLMVIFDFDNVLTTQDMGKQTKRNVVKNELLVSLIHFVVPVWDYSNHRRKWGNEQLMMMGMVGMSIGIGIRERWFRTFVASTRNGWTIKKRKLWGFRPNPAILWVNPSSQLLVGGSCLCFTPVKVIFIPWTQGIPKIG